MVNEDFVIGIDGGATKTTAVAANARGKMLGWATTGPSNYQSAGLEAAVEMIENALAELVKKAGIGLEHCRLVALFLAGVNQKSDQSLMIESLKDMLKVPLFIDNDVVASWAGATLCSPGIVVIAGTGSNAYGVDVQGNVAQAGGWGHVLGDEGSAYGIGIEGIKAALMAFDGRGESTSLEQSLLKAFDIETPADMNRLVYQAGMGKLEIARFARTVCAEAMSGDDAAVKIITNAAEALCRHILAVMRKLNNQGPFVVHTAGSAFTCKLLTETFKKKLALIAPGADVALPAVSPAVGAVLIAGRKVGWLEALLARVETDVEWRL